WWTFSGNWLATPENHLAKYTAGPETAHLLWVKPLTFGGLVGGELEDSSYHDGDAYEGKWFPPVIINGVVYYNKYPSNFNMPGYYAVDLRTGEEIYFNDQTSITIGQLYDYNSMNQHGTFAYLWNIAGTGFFGGGTATWTCYDAFSGDYWYTITDAPSAPFAFTSTPQMSYGEDGSILIQSIDTINHRLLVWNSSEIVDLYGGTTGSNYWQWRPYGKTVSGASAYSVNASIPANVNGSVSFIFDDMLIVSSGLGMGGGGFTFIETSSFTVWALSLKSGEEGKLLWEKTYTTLPGQTSGVTLNLGPASIEDGVFTIRSSQTMEWWGFSLNDGSYMWGPTEPQTAWDSLVGTQAYIAYGNMYAGGYGGILYCYDVTTGAFKWSYRLIDNYYLEAKWGGNYNIGNMLIADGKVYLFSGEHSPDDPKERGTLLRCVDAYSGDEIWTFPFYDPNWSVNPAIADGILVHLNAYDNQIYAFGKGESETYVDIYDDTITFGETVVIKGSVTDLSAGSAGTPAISDKDMSLWMQYVYLQKPLPTDATGVPVKLAAINENGECEEIGTVVSDITGQFSIMWKPSNEGLYTISAVFDGTESYYGSSSQTFLGVVCSTDSSTSDSNIAGLPLGAYILTIIVIIIVILLALMLYRKRQ
ncbi:MAG: PQQ-like beta-propeller repeat protein, partial [Crenarchaeota archaeon]|nr:PQQ-like beta-propeller repeat protein [Thermoproteota archaeon]